MLTTVIEVFENFTYHRELASDDGLNVVSSSAPISATRSSRASTLIRFNEAGQIVEFEVMVRPMSGLQALAPKWANG